MSNLVYFSSVSENTHRFVTKLGLAATRIPLHGRIEVDEPYVLVLPTYGGGHATPDINDGGYVPKQVIAFLNNEHNRSLIRGVIAAGNNNFGAEFAYAGEVVSRKCGVPYLYRFELMGTPDDVEAVRVGLRRLLEGPDVSPTVTAAEPVTVPSAAAARDGLPRAQRDAESVRRGRQDSVRQGSRSRAPVLPGAREPEHGVLPRSGREARLPDQGELLRARGARPILAQLRQDTHQSRLRQEVPLPDVPRRVQVLHQLHAEDL